MLGRPFLAAALMEAVVSVFSLTGRVAGCNVRRRQNINLYIIFAFLLVCAELPTVQTLTDTQS